MAIVPFAVPLANKSPENEKRIQTAWPLLRSRAESESGMSCASNVGSVSGKFIAGGSVDVVWSVWDVSSRVSEQEARLRVKLRLRTRRCYASAS